MSAELERLKAAKAWHESIINKYNKERADKASEELKATKEMTGVTETEVLSSYDNNIKVLAKRVRSCKLYML